MKKIKNALEVDIPIDPSRLLGLTEGIFGIVMTLLIFGITLPDLMITNYTNYISFIINLLPTIGTTIVSFILVSSFWIYHHEFIKIKKLNLPYLWINIIFLINISFIPFTTSIITNYSHFFLSEVIFGINILLVIISFILMYYYAYSRKFLEKKAYKKRKTICVRNFWYNNDINNDNKLIRLQHIIKFHISLLVSAYILCFTCFKDKNCNVI